MIQDAQFETTTPAVTPKRGSPWSNLGRRLTGEEYSALKAWLIDNPGGRLKAGFVREDGLVFAQYCPCSRGGESWISISRLHERRRKARERAALRLATKEAREKRNLKRRMEYAASPIIRKKSRQRADRWLNGMSEDRRNQLNARCRELAKIRASKRTEIFSDAKYNRHRPEMAFRGAQIRCKEKGAYLHPDRNDSSIANLFKTRHGMVICHKRNYDIDHIIPIHCAGPHHEENLQILPAKINRQKGGNRFWTSTEYKDWRDVPESLWPPGIADGYRAVLRVFGRSLKTIAEVA